MVKKGDHEKSMECAKRLIQEGLGMEEITKRTNLTIEDVQKAHRKMEGKQ